MTFEEFGQELRAQRVARSVSLTEISAETRINQRFLEAIEHGQFSLLPQAYIRAFLREYASTVGLPVEQVLQQYADIAGQPASVSTPKGEAPTRTITTSERPATPSTPVTLPAALRPFVFGAIILGASALAFWLLQNDGGGSAPPTTSGEIPFDRVIRETEAALPVDSISRFAVSPAPTPILTQDSLTLEMTTVDSVWINIVIDERTAEDYLFAPDRRRIWKARDRFTVTMGNAGGATFRLNGKELGALGRRGAVLRNSVITADLLR